MDKPGILKVLVDVDAKNVLAHARNVQCSCPLSTWEHSTGKDRKPSMGISIDPKGPSLVNCFGCGFRGTLAMLVERYSGHMPDAMNWSAYLLDLYAKEEIDPSTVVERLVPYETSENPMAETVIEESLLDPFRGLAHPYITRRGFDIDTLRAWEVGYDEEQKRVILPVRSRDGNALVGAIGRGIQKEARPKYLNYWTFEKGLYLFGEHKLQGYVTDDWTMACKIVIVEGPLDALRVWQEFTKLGREVDVVALMGAKPTWKQLRKLEQWATEIVLCLDNDAAGWEGTRILLDSLSSKVVMTAVKYPSAVGDDPDSLGPAIVDMIDHAEFVV